jgi:hypothetical protein
LGQGGDEGALSSFAGQDQQPAALAAIDNAAGGPGNGTTPADSGVLFQGQGPNRTMLAGSMLANAGAAIAGISNPQQGNSLRGIASGLEQQASGEFQYQLGPNGQLIRINKRDGTVNSMSIQGGQKPALESVKRTNPNTGVEEFGSYDKQSGKYTWETPAQGSSETPQTAEGETPPPGLGPEGLKVWRKEKAKQLIDLPNASNRLKQVEFGMDAIEKDATEILKSPYLPNISGPIGALPMIPGYPPADLKVKIDSLVSKLTLDTLTDLRNASKTGGAVGNASDTDMKILGTKVANLKAAQSLEAKQAALQDVISFARDAKGRQQSAFYEMYPQKKPKQDEQQPQQPAKSGGGLAPGWSVVAD